MSGSLINPWRLVIEIIEMSECLVCVCVIIVPVFFLLHVNHICKCFSAKRIHTCKRRTSKHYKKAYVCVCKCVCRCLFVCVYVCVCTCVCERENNRERCFCVCCCFWVTAGERIFVSVWGMCVFAQQQKRGFVYMCVCLSSNECVREDRICCVLLYVCTFVCLLSVLPGPTV